jgi:glyoxylase-like metal-dependent hydrolase (beta-lactamase superfamily II)
MENGYLFPTYLYGASPIRELKRKSKSVDVDVVLDYGTNKIGDEKFEIISLKGHSVEQIGIATPDRVCFLGDSLFSKSIMEKYTFPFLFDIEEQLKTIEYIKTLEYDHFVLSHGDRIYGSEEIRELANENKMSIEKYLSDISELLNQPLTREDILEQICIKNDMKLDYKSYHLCLSSTGAFIAYLYNKDMLEYEVENGKLYYYRSI